MLDSGVRLAAASLPVGVPVIVGLVVAVLRRRELPAVSTPAIAGLAVQLVVVLISTFLVAATSFDAFSLSPETLLPLSSVLGFVVILLQVVSWTLLLIALFRRLPGTPPAPAPAAAAASEDRTPTGRHALVDDRGDQVIAEAGTTFLPVGAGAGAPRTGPRPVTGPPAPPPPGAPPIAPGPPPGPAPSSPQGVPPGPPQGGPYRATTVTRPGPPPGAGPSSPTSSPLPSLPIPGADTPSPSDSEEEAAEAVATPAAPDPTDTESADTETIRAYREPVAEQEPDDAEDATPEVAEDATPDEAADEAADDDAGTPDDGRYPGYLQEATDGAAEPEAAPTTGYPGYLDGVERSDENDSEDETPPGEDVDEEPPADADTGDAADTPADAEQDAASAGGHPWFDPDGEAARSTAAPDPR